MHVSYVRIGLWRCIHPIRFVRKASFPENLPELDADGETIDFFLPPSNSLFTSLERTHVRPSCVYRSRWEMIIQREEFSERRSMQRSCVTFFNIYFYFYSCKIDYTLSENETNSSLKIWPKISFHKDNQSWGNKNSPPCLWNTVYRRHRQPTTRAGHGRPFCPLQSSNPPTLSRVKRYTIHTPCCKARGS